MNTLTQQILKNMNTHKRVETFERGFSEGRNGKADKYSGHVIAKHRAAVGFKEVAADLLTPPDANLKLDKAVTPTYGLTLAHAQMSQWNACPWAGDCTKVCVLNNGNGRYSTVQNAWLWRTNLLGTNTQTAIYRIGWELGRAVRKHGQILFRPNVNSDLLWNRILPTLGTLPEVITYGYTKNPAVLEMDHTHGIYYSYSFNENSNIAKVRNFLHRGGNVAVVTNRKPKTEIDKDLLREALGVDPSVNVADADVTDEWMLQSGTIGDLSAKGKARELIGSSGFVLCAY